MQHDGIIRDTSTRTVVSSASRTFQTGSKLVLNVWYFEEIIANFSDCVILRPPVILIR